MPDTAMPSPLSQVEMVVPVDMDLEEVLAARPMMPFSDPVIEFIDGFGKSLRRDPALRRFPELVALGYWARRSTISRLRTTFETAYPDAVRMPRGLAFHVAPSNVDTIFVYSLMLSMLAGNANLIRMSSRGGEQTNHLLHLLSEALSKAPPEIRAANAVIRYPHTQTITDALSERADIRIVWGGDTTVRAIRQSQLAPRGVELVFPNRYSLAVFDAEAWLAEPDKIGVAAKFVNDTLWFGQMACSSPRVLVWRGDAAHAERASDSFWPLLDEAAVAAALPFEPADAVAKLVAEQSLAMTGKVDILPSRGNHIRRVRDSGLDQLSRDAAAGGGFFVECRLRDLAELTPSIARNWQTVVSYGIEAAEWREFMARERPVGIDRIVPVGSALDFDAIWDGTDLLTSMTRLATIGIAPPPAPESR